VGIFGTFYESNTIPITLGTLYVSYTIQFFEPIPRLATESMDRPGITKNIMEVE